jgi:triosephosphate isomerase
MQQYMVAGNWKLNLGPKAAAELAAAVQQRLAPLDLRGEVLVCPPCVSIPAVAAHAQGQPLLLGAQNCAEHDQGAFTGEVSAGMLREAGCTHVIIAHSERRQYQQENDEQFIRKIDLVHAAGMTAIFCYGEVIAERRAGSAEAVVRRQLQGVLPQLAHVTAENLILAYEPVWAIGTGETATPAIAQAMHQLSRQIANDLLGSDVAQSLRILYGGSCKPSNAAELFSQPDVDGGLIGGASLKVDDFVGIVTAAQDVY